MRKFVAIIFIFMLVLTGCLNKNGEGVLKEKDVKPLTSTSLTFYPNIKHLLMLGEPQKNMRLVKSISFQEANGFPPSTVHLYSDVKTPDLIYAFLEEGGKRYDVGEVSSEGLTPVEVTISHWTGEEEAEIQIVGYLAAETNHLRLLRYNPTDGNWEHFDFQGHQTEQIDLDGDGNKELAGNHVNYVPPFIEVHRWNVKEDAFETAQIDIDASKLYKVDRDKVLTYSYLFQENGQWIIEFGTAEEVHFMKYNNGMLENMIMNDNRSRLKELKKVSVSRQ